MNLSIGPSSGDQLHPNSTAPPRRLSAKALQMMGPSSSQEVTGLITGQAIPIDSIKNESQKSGAIKAAIVGAHVFVALLSPLIGLILLGDALLNKSNLWNFAMSIAFLPAGKVSSLTGKPKAYQAEKFENLAKDNPGSELNIKIPVGDKKVVLNGAFIGNKNDPGRPTVIFFCQNKARYEEQYELARSYVEDHKCNILMANYQSVGLSSGGLPTCAQDLIDNGVAMMEYVTKELDIPAGSVILHGSSLGGAVATQVAKEFPEAHLRNERSFTKWSDAAQGLVNQYSFIGSLVKAITNDSKWEMDSIAAWQERETKTNKGFTHFQTADCDEILNGTSRMGDAAIESEYDQRTNTFTTHTGEGHTSSLKVAHTKIESEFLDKVKHQILEEAGARFTFEKK